MNELDDDARSLLESARGGHDPLPGEDARIRHRVAIRVGLATAAAAAATQSSVAPAAAAAAPSASALGPVIGAGSATLTSGLVTKVIAAIVLASAVGGGTYVAATNNDRRPTLTLTRRASSVTAQSDAGQSRAGVVAGRSPEQDGASGASAAALAPSGLPSDLAAPRSPAPPVDGAASPATDSSSATPAVRMTPTTPLTRVVKALTPGGGAAPMTAPPAAPSANAGREAVDSSEAPAPAAAAGASAPKPAIPSLADEARALADAQRALREGHGEAALGLLDAQQRAFKNGALGDERAAARVLALCEAGRIAEARADAERFLAAAPHSPLSARVRASCIAR